MTVHTPTTQTDTVSPSMSRKKALILFGVSVLAMIPGWLLGSYIPLWVAPVTGNLITTFLLYFLSPILLWGGVVFVLFRRWRITLSGLGWMSWGALNAVMFVVWVVVFLLSFGSRYDDSVIWWLIIGNHNVTCEVQIQPSGVEIHICSDEHEDDEVLFSSRIVAFSGTYTFEGREGLPFVWYTGKVPPDQDED